MRRLYVPLELCVYRGNRPMTGRFFYQTWLDERTWIRQTLIPNHNAPAVAGYTVELECKGEIWSDWINMRVSLLDNDGCPYAARLPALLYARPHAVPMVTVFPPHDDGPAHVLTVRVVDETSIQEDL